MVTYRGFTAWIVSEGITLPEYLLAFDSSANKVSCWIPCETGKSFAVHWKDEGTLAHSCGFIYLDGSLVPGRFLPGCGETKKEGIRTSHSTERPFVFVENANALPGAQVNREAGTIILKIRLSIMDSERAANLLHPPPEHVGPQGNSLSHYICYGKERNTSERYPFTWHVPDDGAGNRSYVTFVFRYRSRKFLLDQSIIPREDRLLIPPVVRRACSSKINRRIVSAPARTYAMAPCPTPSSHTIDNAELMMMSGSTSNLQHVPVQPATNVQSGSTEAAYPHGHYPGEGVLDFGRIMVHNMIRVQPDQMYRPHQLDDGPDR